MEKERKKERERKREREKKRKDKERKIHQHNRRPYHLLSPLFFFPTPPTLFHSFSLSVESLFSFSSLFESILFQCFIQVVLSLILTSHTVNLFLHFIF